LYLPSFVGITDDEISTSARALVETVSGA